MGSPRSLARRCALPIAVALLALPAAAQAELLKPLPASDYTSRPVCAPPAHRRASCLADRLVPLTGAARRHSHPLGVPRARALAEPTPQNGDFGLRPSDIHDAYSLPSEAPAGSTVAIVDAYNDPQLETDLAAYDKAFNLPECTEADGCLRVRNEHGATAPLPFPATRSKLREYEKEGGKEALEAEAAVGWDVEISLDVETVHATCQNCSIVLFEASSEQEPDLFEAERSAEALTPSAITNSWGGEEEAATDDTAPFDDPDTVITAAAGDEGYLGWYRSYEECELQRPEPTRCALHYEPSPYFPASSPDVVAVGGTRLTLAEGSDAWQGETVWNGVDDRAGAGGSGCSTLFAAPQWQSSLADWASVGCGNARAVADVSADAAPESGFAVYDSMGECESLSGTKVVDWCTIGGTSLASPIIASSFALAGGAHGTAYPAELLYENERATPGSLHDVTSGSNGGCELLAGCETFEEAASCHDEAICVARSGYDGPTGVGTPDGLAAFRPPATPAKSETRAAPLRILALALSRRASAALRSRHAVRRALTFTVRASSAGHARVRLYRLVRVHGHPVWRATRATRLLSLPAGASSWRLQTAPLARGRYMLSLTPLSAGAARALRFSVA